MSDHATAHLPTETPSSDERTLRTRIYALTCMPPTLVAIVDLSLSFLSGRSLPNICGPLGCGLGLGLHADQPVIAQFINLTVSGL